MSSSRLSGCKTRLRQLSVTVQNAAEKGAWCWFSCSLDQQIEKAAADERAKVRSELSKSAKRFKLRLRML